LRTSSTLSFLTLLFLFHSSVSFCADEPNSFASERRAMVRTQIQSRGVTDPAVLEAMLKVKRHLFVSPRQEREAYSDHPLPIGYGQTISQPYIVAVMTEELNLSPNSVVLEVGTGSGYQAAILAKIVKEVYTIEIVKPLAEQARARLEKLDYKNVTVKQGDGYFGWEEFAPFDAIVVTAAASHIPPPLIEQLKPGGKMVIPVGPVFFVQQLLVIEKKKDGTITQRSLMAVRFVPLTGEH